METINGHIINTLPIKGLKKISDLQYYDGPLLSHFVDEKDNNYLYYWVDYNTDCNRWLVWKTSINQLYGYLHGKTTLLEVILAPNKDFIYSVDLDRELNYTSVWAIELDQIPTEYLPEEESFFMDDIPEYYQKELDVISVNNGEYLELLREDSINFKLKPSSPTYGTTISTSDAADFLKNLSNSFGSFVEYSFFDVFKESYTDSDILNKQIKKVQKDLTPRISNLEYSSFKISIATDFLQRDSSDSRFVGWKKTVLKQYKSTVIDIDYSSIDVINNIIATYDEYVRKKIFAPFIEIIDSSDYNLEISEYRKPYRKLHPYLKKEFKKILFPKSQNIDLENDKKKLVNVVMEVDENQDISKISKKIIHEGFLFSKDLDETTMDLKEINVKNYTVKLIKPISFSIKLIDNIYYFENVELNIFGQTKQKDKLMDKIQDEVIRTRIDADNEHLLAFNNYIETFITL